MYYQHWGLAKGAPDASPSETSERAETCRPLHRTEKTQRGRLSWPPPRLSFCLGHLMISLGRRLARHGPSQATTPRRPAPDATKTSHLELRLL
jgi:hypothetical protein